VLIPRVNRLQDAFASVGVSNPIGELLCLAFLDEARGEFAHNHALREQTFRRLLSLDRALDFSPRKVWRCRQRVVDICFHQPIEWQVERIGEHRREGLFASRK
jgi:hypothetical protein